MEKELLELLKKMGTGLEEKCKESFGKNKKEIEKQGIKFVKDAEQTLIVINEKGYTISGREEAILAALSCAIEGMAKKGDIDKNLLAQALKLSLSEIEDDEEDCFEDFIETLKEIID